MPPGLESRIMGSCALFQFRHHFGLCSTLTLHWLPCVISVAHMEGFSCRSSLLKIMFLRNYNYNYACLKPILSQSLNFVLFLIFFRPCTAEYLCLLPDFLLCFLSNLLFFHLILFFSRWSPWSCLRFTPYFHSSATPPLALP